MSESNSIPVESSDNENYDGTLWGKVKQLERNMTKLNEDLKITKQYWDLWETCL